VRTGDSAVVAFDGDLTSSTVLGVRPQILALVTAGVREIVFDFNGTSFVDSSGIGMMLSAHNALSKAGGRIQIVGASNDLLTLFRAMRLDKHFTVAGK
jgi:anti-anti-sigma factor